MVRTGNFGRGAIVTTDSGTSDRALRVAPMFAAEWVVEPGYEAVRDAFVAGSGTFGRGGGAYCAYVNGKPVVDVWAGEAQPGEPWRKDTATVLDVGHEGTDRDLRADPGRPGPDRPGRAGGDVLARVRAERQGRHADPPAPRPHRRGDRVRPDARGGSSRWGRLGGSRPDRPAARRGRAVVPTGHGALLPRPDDRLAPGGAGSSGRRPHARPLLRRRGRRATRPRSLDRRAGRGTVAGGAHLRHAPRPPSSPVAKGPGERLWPRRAIRAHASAGPSSATAPRAPWITSR